MKAAHESSTTHLIHKRITNRLRVVFSDVFVFRYCTPLCMLYLHTLHLFHAFLTIFKDELVFYALRTRVLNYLAAVVLFPFIIICLLCNALLRASAGWGRLKKWGHPGRRAWNFQFAMGWTQLVLAGYSC